jgi:hypothetical protein
MDQVEAPIAWLLESDDNDAGRRAKTFLARIEGRYLALKQMQTHGEEQSGELQMQGKIIGRQVSAKSQEFVDIGGRNTHLAPIVMIFLPSLGTLKVLTSTLGVFWKRVTVRGRGHIARAF